MFIRWKAALLCWTLWALVSQSSIGMADESVATAATAIREGRLQYGWSQQSIVPNRPVAIGGQYETRISGVVHDPLTVTALAVETRDESGSINQLIWVSCDMVGIRKKNVDRIRHLIAQRLDDFDPQKLIISATHTHTAPALTDTDEKDLHPYDFARSWAYRIPADATNVMKPLEFADYLEQQIATAAVQAWQSRQPGEFSFALSHVSVARNRRAVFFDGTTRMYGDTRDPMFSHIEGMSDDSLDGLFFWRDGELVGTGLTLYCPSQEVEGEAYLSADFWHDTRLLLRERYGADLFVLPLTGASGDQSPHVQVARDAETNMLDQFRVSYRQEIARRIVDAVDDVIGTARSGRQTHLRFEHQVESLSLPVWQVTASRYADSSANVTQGQNRLDQLTAPEYIRWRVDETMKARYELQTTAPHYQAESHAVRLDELALATNPFELYTDYAARMKARSPAKQTAIVQLTADCPAYLPTERAVQGGGYSARIDDGVVGPEGGRVLVEETVRMLKSLW